MTSQVLLKVTAKLTKPLFGGLRKRIRVYTAHQCAQVNASRLRRLAQSILKSEGWHFDLQIILADDEELRRLHRTFLGQDETTDVMAFPGTAAEDLPSEIYLNLDQARQQALDDNETVQRAAERLLIHGILHLGGWRDDTAPRRRKMLSYGERYLATLSPP